MTESARSRRVTVLFIGETSMRHREHLEQRIGAQPEIKAQFVGDIDDEALKLVREAYVIVAGHPTRELLDSAQNLKLFIVPFAGVQHVIELFRGRAVTLANAHWNAYFTAQHMVALLLALTNRIVPHHVRMAEGHWRIWENGLASIPLKGRKIGLLGYGHVNRNTHKLLSGFDAGFAILKRSWEGFAEPLPTPAARFEARELDSFLTFTDVLLVALPLTSQTEGIIRMPELELLGPDGLLVNVSRGRLIDEHDLYTALERRVIAGAALDVWYNYKPEPDVEGRRYPYDPAHPFHALGNVVLSPHRGASPIYKLSRWDEVIENIQRFSQGEEPINVVDIEHGY